MQDLLVAYSSGEGQTAKIAQYVAELGRAAQLRVELCDVAHILSTRSLREFDGIIVGGSIHGGKHAPDLRKFVVDHAPSLNSRPSAFFSVSLSAAGDKDQQHDAWRCLNEFLKSSAWSPAQQAIIAGAIRYRAYGFLKRMLMKRVLKQAGGETDTTRNFEYTDWDQVEGFTAEFFQRMSTEKLPAGALG
jgi:menaquinone-dependent protoporphyrinogen oxidase